MDNLSYLKRQMYCLTDTHKKNGNFICLSLVSLYFVTVKWHSILNKHSSGTGLRETWKWCLLFQARAGEILTKCELK